MRDSSKWFQLLTKPKNHYFPTIKSALFIGKIQCDFQWAYNFDIYNWQKKGIIKYLSQNLLESNSWKKKTIEREKNVINNGGKNIYIDK